MQLHLARMTPDELQTQIDAAPLAILPVGTLEWHGPHLPLGLDAIKIEALAEHLAARNGVTVAPAIYYGVCENLVPRHGFPGTLEGIRRATLRDYVVQIGTGLRQLGYRALFILSGHYEPCQLDALGQAADELNRLGLITRLAIEEEFTQHLAPGDDGPSPSEATYRYRGGHAGEFETSIMLTVAPELVHLDRAPEELAVPLEATLDGDPVPTHVQVSHPRRANAAHGAEIYDLIMSGGTRVIREMLDQARPKY